MTAGQVEIVVPAKATSPEKIAAEDLALYLGKLYSQTSFEVRESASGSGDFVIRLGTPASAPALTGQEGLAGPESWVVTTDGANNGIIIGADPAGVMYGVYGLLERLGCGFFISLDTMPEPKTEPFSLNQWDLRNHPTIPLRISFNWHNFLTGCSTWGLQQWKEWINRSQQSGFNTIMVHAYGGSPMYTFEFNGISKEVGFLESSRYGRTCSIAHVDDVRKLTGGFLFDKPIFGGEASQVPPESRVEAIQQMMGEVFEHAEQRGVDVVFAIDIDKQESCNPPEMIATLPESDRFQTGNRWLARPDTPGGFAFYKAQANGLLKLYPGIDVIALWRRRGGTEWTATKLEELPASWQEEYKAYITDHPKAARHDQSVGAFAMSKLFKAWRQALDELARNDVRLATGSWGFDWWPDAAEFLPDDVLLMPLDYGSKDGEGEFRAQKHLKRMSQAQPPNRLIPIIWSQHDDGAYIGAPLAIHRDFSSRLKKASCGGFGIIHWMTFPYDPYFTSHNRQVWAATENEPIETTAEYVAERWFGHGNKDIMSNYLMKWLADMPKFGRETTELFIDHEMKKYAELDDVVAGYQERMAILKQAVTGSMTGEQKQRLDFFKDYEKFVHDIFQVQNRYDQAMEAVDKEDFNEARKLIAQCDPYSIVQEYAKAVHKRGATRGELGLVVTMNLRWLFLYDRLKQHLGMEPVYYNYGLTTHDSLTRSPGTFTFHAEGSGKTLWQTFGEKETRGGEVFEVSDEVNPANAVWADVCRSGVEKSEPLKIGFEPIRTATKKNRLPTLKLPAGRYKLTLLMIEPAAEAAGERVMQINVGGKTSNVDIFKQAGGKSRVLALEYLVELSKPGNPEVLLTSVKGKVLLCGAVLSPDND